MRKCKRLNPARSILRAKRHDGVDDIVVVLLERLNRLLPAHARLRHHELNVLGLESRLVDLFAVVLFLVLLLGTGVDGLALVAVVVAGVGVGTAFL